MTIVIDMTSSKKVLRHACELMLVIGHCIRTGPFDNRRHHRQGRERERGREIEREREREREERER